MTADDLTYPDTSAQVSGGRWWGELRKTFKNDQPEGGPFYRCVPNACGIAHLLGNLAHGGHYSLVV